MATAGLMHALDAARDTYAELCLASEDLPLFGSLDLAAQRAANPLGYEACSVMDDARSSAKIALAAIRKAVAASAEDADATLIAAARLAFSTAMAADAASAAVQKARDTKGSHLSPNVAIHVQVAARAAHEADGAIDAIPTLPDARRRALAQEARPA